MLDTVAFIGVGHLAEFMIKGLRKTDTEMSLQLYNPSSERVLRLVAKDPKSWRFDRPQQAVQGAQLVVVATRPDVVVEALRDVEFEPGQVVISVAAGVTLSKLQALVSPGIAIRSMPVSCVEINKSPTLLYPYNKLAISFFKKLGQVHNLHSEAQFNPATALVGAYYAWLFPLMGQLSQWAEQQGLEAGMARQLLIEINQGACSMATEQRHQSLQQIWQSLATPGGISALGMKKIQDLGAIDAWCEALDDVTAKMDK